MQLNYRGQQYTVNSEDTAPVDAQLTYRGVEHNPSEQTIAPATNAQLTYRGAQYVRMRAQIAKASRLAAARKAFTRNLSASAIV